MTRVDDWLTPDEFAERYKFSVAGVTRACREGRLPARKILNRWRIDPRLDSLEESGDQLSVARVHRRRRDERAA